MRALSLFSGLGGLDIGAARAGFDVQAAVDNDETALRYLSASLDIKTMRADIGTQCAEELASNAGVTDSELIIFGGPPCTGFSHAGFWLERKRTAKDAAVNYVFDFIRLIEYLQPAAFLLENVPGLAFKTYKHILDELIQRAKSSGYEVNFKILNASHYGVPQARRRLFIVGCKDFLFEFPDPRTSDYPRSSEWAIGNLSAEENPPERGEVPTGKYSDLISEVPPGDNYLHFTKKRGYPNPKFNWRSKYWSFLLKLDPEKPSPTIPASRITYNGPFHWENRHLRRREIARLQTFPDSFPLPPAPEARRYLGNAVPPLLSLQLFISLRKQLGHQVSQGAQAMLDECLSPTAEYKRVSDSLTCAPSTGGDLKQ